MSKVAIIGTRNPSLLQRQLAGRAARVLSEAGYVISTGAADGIDTDAMLHTDPNLLEVYLPWNGYNQRQIPAGSRRILYDPGIHSKWTESVRLYHPAWQRLTRGPLALHARNYGIVENCKAVLAFPDAAGGGGTGQGIRIAKALGIPLWQVNKGVRLANSVEEWVQSVLATLSGLP